MYLFKRIGNIKKYMEADAFERQIKKDILCLEFRVQNYIIRFVVVL